MTRWSAIPGPGQGADDERRRADRAERARVLDEAATSRGMVARADLRAGLRSRGLRRGGIERAAPSDLTPGPAARERDDGQSRVS